MSSSFWKSGHRPTLIASFLYFDFAFMAWVILGPLAPLVADDLHLNAAQTGFMVALPTLLGALLRIPMGMLGDRIGTKVTGALGQVIVIAGLMGAWMVGIGSFASVLTLGLVLGFAGASFAVALPLASRWYPPEHQGKALGIAGMGLSGTAIAALFAPTLAGMFGWTTVLALVCIPLTIVLFAYMALAKDPPERPAPKKLSAYLVPLKDRDAWWFMLFYAVTFGGYSGLASSLSIYFVSQFGLTPVQAGYCTAGCALAGSLVRPMGGALGDRIGGIRTLSIVYSVAALALIAVSTGPTSLPVALALFVIAMLSFGTGNGAVFQLVPQRFRKEIGVMTGLVGCAGGIGGFFLASSLGLTMQLLGSPQFGFLIFATIALIALIGLSSIKKRWRTTWGAAIQGVRI